VGRKLCNREVFCKGCVNELRKVGACSSSTDAVRTDAACRADATLVSLVRIVQLGLQPSWLRELTAGPFGACCFFRREYRQCLENAALPRVTLSTGVAFHVFSVLCD
jgi:hypothetical protein